MNLNVIYSSTIDKIHFRIMTVAFLLILFMYSENDGALAKQGESISTSFTEINHRHYTAKYTLGNNRIDKINLRLTDFSREVNGRKSTTVLLQVIIHDNVSFSFG